MAYYPVFLDLRGRACVVVGGGDVAERKVRGLVDAEARITIVSPTITEGIAELARAGRVTHVPRAYRAGDLAGHQLAFVATDAPDVTAAVAAEARERGVWVNAADDAEHSDFILPSVLRRGSLAVAVGTGGASPALARLVREELDRYLPDDYALLADVAADARRELRAHGVTATGEDWTRALDAEVRRLVAEGRGDEARARLVSRLQPGARR